MAPICEGFVASPVTFCSSYGPRSGVFWDDAWDMTLPIWRKGLFMNDSFFQYVYEAFESAVTEILHRWGVTDFVWDQWKDPKLRLSNALTCYRQLRTHNLKEEDQAVTVTCDATSQKIMMDVHDFLGGEVKVKVASERELVVEGRTETMTGDLSMSSNSFRRRFCLQENIEVRAVSAVLSDDGILTIIAPIRKVAPEVIIPIRHNSDQQPARERWTPATPQRRSFTSSSGVLQHPRVTELTGRKMSFGDNVVRKPDPVPRNFGLVGEYNMPALPIPQMGLFFSDPFFHDAWLDFQEAVRDVLSKWGDLSCPDDPVAQYRDLRTRDLREESQAVGWTEDEAGHKFVLDVQDFIGGGGRISVQFVSDREVVVEGYVEDKGQCSCSCRKFERRFLIPSCVDVQAVSAVVSADGVLTITAPKKTETPAATLPQRGPAKPLPSPEEWAECFPTHRPPPAPRRVTTASEPRVDSPTPSIQSCDSSDSAGQLWTFSPPLDTGSLTIEEVE